MEYSEFRNLVGRMRTTQKEFFAGNKSVLDKSKGLEKLVDDELIGRDPSAEQRGQLRMF